MHLSAARSEPQWDTLFEAAQSIMDFAVAMGAARPKSNVTVREVLDEFQADKVRMGKSKRYLRQMRVSVKGLLGARLAGPITAVSPLDLQAAT